MISRRLALRTGLGTLLAMAGRSAAARAQTPPGPTIMRKEIFRQALPTMPGKEVVVISLDYAPGAGSTRHRHPSQVFAYVAKGAVVSQLEGQAAVRYGEGEMWYEAPGTIHLGSRNASATEPARLVAFFVADHGQTLTEPLG